MIPQLKPVDLWGLRRAMDGLPYDPDSMSPWLAGMVSNMAGQKGAATALLSLLGPDITIKVLQVDPNTEPPTPAKDEPEPIVTPALPVSAQLSDQALRQAESAGRWLDEFMTWATRRSPMTPPKFLEAGGVWLLSLAIARRVALRLHAPIYPHLYVLWIARTSIFKKSTGLTAITDLAYAAMPHMLLPEESTPEAFAAQLAGKKPNNYDQLSPYEKKIDDWGRLYAAQRGIAIDEATSLIGGNKKDYLAGLPELLMKLYDAPIRLARNLRSEGKIVIRDASLCIIGATTPASLRRNTDRESWETGELARYALLYPENTLPYDTSGDEFYNPPAPLITRLKRLHECLPKPPDPILLGDDQPQSLQAHSCQISKEAHAAYQAYAKAVTYDMLRDRAVDEQLHPNYSRLHIQAVKIATALACIDWCDSGADGNPIVTLGHWAKAQQIAETWRYSLHRLIADMSRTEDDMIETKIMDHLALYPEGETLRDLVRRVHIRRSDIENAIKSLLQSGLITAESRQGKAGPATTTYRIL